MAEMCIYQYVILSYKATLAFILKGIGLLFQVKSKSWHCSQCELVLWGIQSFDHKECENHYKVPSARSNKPVTHTALHFFGHRCSSALNVGFTTEY